MGEIRHVCLSIRGALAMSAKDFAQSYDGVFSDDSGRPLSAMEARAELERELAKGHEIVPAAGCDNFDWVTGCKGHQQDENNKGDL